MIEGIASKDVEIWWPYVQEYLNEALKYGLGEYSIDDIKNACISRNMQLWVNIGSNLEAACITKINKYPQTNILVILLLGGKSFDSWCDEGDYIMTAYAKENKCNHIQLFGRRGWINKMNKLNYDHKKMVLTKEIV
jgi:hypothetical protein